MKQIKATMGNTTYAVEGHKTPGMCTIVRLNQDGEACFHVPIALFEQATRETLRDLADDWIDRVLRK